MAAPLHDTVTVSGFTVIQVKFEEKSKACHCLYLKDHKVRQTDDTKPKDKTIFVVNIPPYANEKSLENIFSECGAVTKVYIQDKPSSETPADTDSKLFSPPHSSYGFKVAYVVFKKALSVGKAKKMFYSTERVLSTPDAPIITGIKKWCKMYKELAPNQKELQAEIDEFMSAYDENIEEEKRVAKEQEGVPDDDGWVTVTKHGKNKGIPRTEAQETKVSKRERKKRKDKELLNFYAFQIRDSKRENLAKLREQFEEDKQKIQIMKAQRKFRPY